MFICLKAQPMQLHEKINLVTTATNDIEMYAFGKLRKKKTFMSFSRKKKTLLVYIQKFKSMISF